MARISVTNLTFCYEGSFDNVFEDVSFSIDTDWKLAFIGRNGKGKTNIKEVLKCQCQQVIFHIKLMITCLECALRILWKN